MRPRPDTLFGTAARASIGRAGDEPVRMRAASHPPSQKVGIFVSLLVMMLSLFSPDVEAQQAHEHGVATLNVVLDGKKLVVQLESPLDNLVGFEHAPRNDKQRAALAKMEESLQAGDRWFRPAAAAGCTLRDVKVEHPYRTPSTAGQTSPGSGKRSGPDAKGKAAKSEEQHAEVRAAYELDCAKPEVLDRMEVLLFDAFPSMKRLKAQMATPRGQGSATLTARKRTLSF